MSDLAIASAAARAARTVSGVLDLSPGLVVRAATYGSGQRVIGVVVRHLTPDTVVLEIHVVLSEVYCNMDSATTALDSARRDAEGIGVVTNVASMIRDVVYRTVRDQDIGRLVLERVDVHVDDLR
ncbi:MAG: hypothetical protein ACRDHP_09210 [Ktedonobacterales bacterium]